MILGRLDRYILKQVRSPILFSFFIFSSLWIVRLLIRVLDLLISKGTEFDAVLKLVLYSLPTIIVASVPMAILMGTMLGLTRLNNDSEIISIKAAGVSSTRIFVPMFFVGVAVSAMVFLLNEKIVPMASFLSQEVYINEIILKKPLPKIAKNIFFEGGEQFKLYVRDYNSEEGLMNDVTLYQFNSGGFPQVTEAKRARLEDNMWIFEQGKTTFFSDEGAIDYYIRFDRWIYPVTDRYAQKIKRKKENRSPSEMNMKELEAEISKRKRQGINPREYETQYYRRTAFPFASLFMILVGAPLCMRHSRGKKSSGFGTGIFIMLIYYVLLSTGKSLGGNGTLDPAIANWIPNAVSGLLGLYFLLRSRV
jgi:lipopolysaccharide export system permease protein